MGRNKEVDAWMARYDNPMKEVVQRMRIIILDASASMQSTDVKPSRFEAARAEALKWVDSLRDEDRMMVLLAGAVTIEYAISPSVTASFAPVTVTVCGTFQLAEVKTSWLVEIVPSVVSLDERSMVTFAVGCVASTTLNVAVPPASVVCKPLAGVT